MDVSMPVMSGIEATRRVVQAHPGPGVLIFGAEVRRDVLRALREARPAGFIRQDCRENGGIRAARSVMACRVAASLPGEDSD